MGRLNDKILAATFAAMKLHLQLVEDYSYFQGTTSYDITITMGDSDFTMMFRPAGKVPLGEMRIRCLPAISRNIADIHDATCICLHTIKESVHSLESLEPIEHLRLLGEDYH